jgi:uncharacterized protein
MNISLNIPWQRYALIAELSMRLNNKCPQFGKTVLQKMVYLFQEIFKIDCGYNYELYSYGPFNSQLLNDLDYVEHIGGVNVLHVDSGKGGFQIKPGEKVEFFREKGKDFLNAPGVDEALTRLIDEFGEFGASELELRSTIVYVERELRGQGSMPTMERVAQVVKGIKPKFSDEDIRNTVDEIRAKRYL